MMNEVFLSKDTKNYFIRLTKEEQKKCRDFSEKCELNARSFSENGTSRSNEDIIFDSYIGKMAEVAVQKLFKKLAGVDIDLDFEQYPIGVWDSNDAEVGKWKIDIKSTRVGNWLLVEWNKLKSRLKENNVATVYILCNVSCKKNKDDIFIPDGLVEYKGMAFISNFFDGSKRCVIKRKGDTISAKKTCDGQSGVKLIADNFAIHSDDLYKGAYMLKALTEKEPRKNLIDEFVKKNKQLFK